jgi:hypothetical protein
MEMQPFTFCFRYKNVNIQTNKIKQSETDINILFILTF